MGSAIQWTDETWNPVVGCTKVSQGCKLCYAKVLHDKRHQAALAGKAMPSQYLEPFETVQLMPSRLSAPLSWRKPRRVFVNSVSDLFHEDVPDEFLEDVYAVMVAAYWHTFQVLTKRPERRRKVLNDPGFRERVAAKAAALINKLRGPQALSATMNLARWNAVAALNIHEGTSVEDQAAADRRIPELLATPAAVRFLSCEPLLGPVSLYPKWFGPVWGEETLLGYGAEPRLHWVIVGGESGAKARPCDLAWIRDVVARCRAVGARVFVKQLGSKPVVFEEDRYYLDGMHEPGTRILHLRDRTPPLTSPRVFV